ncbi:peptidase [Chromatiales bacterium (ex Bugula neritina AB1)]|nr:peptidase [Chromatiales bacterium (ex Bugula neritina AB1)]
MSETISSPPIFDGHNDVLTRLWQKSPEQAHKFFLEGDGEGHLDLPRIKQGGMCGGFFAMWIPSDEPLNQNHESMQGDHYDLPLPPPVPQGDALNIAMAQAAILLRIERESAGQVKICRNAAEVQHCISNNQLAAILHLEGAEPIDKDFTALKVLHAAGLRFLGPVWSRPNRYGHGVPFRYPSSPNIGPGLTDDGKRLVRACNELNIVIDLAHLNEKSFRVVAALSDTPLVATHSNAHANCPVARNLTDWQLSAIRESNGMVGVNFATCFLRADGQMLAETPLQDILHHIDYLIEKLGEDRVGFGSDFDGAVVPDAIGSVAGLPNLRQAMSMHGYDEALQKKICYENWIALLSRTVR